MLTYRKKKILSLIILLIWLPAYIIIIELLIYVVAGIVWALPFKFIFKGIGKNEKDN